jgi:hypothetical protein
MKTLFLFLLILPAACHQPGDKNVSLTDTTIVISTDTIPETRATVKTAPVADYTENIKDELNDWKFSVSIYETKRTFHYTLRMQAKEVRVSDSLNIPNFGRQPKIEIHKGKEPFTCIIGFLDKKDVFKEYRKVNFKNEQLHISTINNYSVSAYRTKVK